MQLLLDTPKGEMLEITASGKEKAVQTISEIFNDGGDI